MFKKILLSITLALILASYFSRQQENFLMPVRNFLVTPKTVVSGNSNQNLPDGMILKASRDGYYVNPYQAASVKYLDSSQVIRESCESIDSKKKNLLLDYAEYFKKTVVYRMAGGKKIAVWEYPIKFNYGLKPGWISGMAQARIALTFAAAGRCSLEPKASAYKELMSLALSSFEVPVDKGGVYVPVPGGAWFEEYAQKGVVPPLVLNGHVYAVMALGLMTELDPLAKHLFNRGINALIKNIAHYDAMTWSYYDRTGKPANNYYQALHARQMKQLFAMTGNGIFESYSNKFFMQRLSPFSSLQRLLTEPSRFLSIIVVIDALLVYLILMFFYRILGKKNKTKKMSLAA